MLRTMILTVRRGTTAPSPWDPLARAVNLLSLPRGPLLSLLPPLVPCPIECSVDRQGGIRLLQASSCSASTIPNTRK